MVDIIFLIAEIYFHPKRPHFLAVLSSCKFCENQKSVMKLKVKVGFALEQVMNVQRESRNMTLVFL
jgi:hypothetical protein